MNTELQKHPDTEKMENKEDSRIDIGSNSSTKL